MGEGEESAPYVTCSQCARLRARKEFQPEQLRSDDPLCKACFQKSETAGSSTESGDDEPEMTIGEHLCACVFGIPLFAAFFAAFLGVQLWIYLLFVIPGLLYKYSGPIKWTIDPIRSFLRRLVFGAPNPDFNPRIFTSDDADADDHGGCLGCCLATTAGIYKFITLYAFVYSCADYDESRKKGKYAVHVVFIGHIIGILCVLMYVGGSIALLVLYIMYITDPGSGQIRDYNNAVQKWQGGLAKEYESNWTSRQLPTLYLEQDVNDANQIQPLTYEPTFQLEISKTFEPSLPQLQPGRGDMQRYEDKVMVAAKIENFHTPSIHPSEGGRALTVRIGEQNFTFATVHQWKEGGEPYVPKTCHFATYLNGLMFVFNEEVQKHACTPLYYNPYLTCHDKWPSLYPPVDLALRVEIRSPHDPVIVASDIIACPSPDSNYFGGSWVGETMRDKWNTFTILAYLVGCCGLALFLFSKPGWLWEYLEWDEKSKPKEAHEEPKKAKADIESGASRAPPHSRQHIGETKTTDPRQSGGWLSGGWFKITSISRQPKVIR